MRDGDVRRALHVRLEREHAEAREQTLFVDELGLCGEARVDVAVVNGSLSGFELKSSSDNLRRLPAQVAVYSRVLDYATLVTAEKHLTHASSGIPDWWGLVVAEGDGQRVTLAELRSSAPNVDVDAYAVAQLLWRDEALAALSARGLDVGLRSKPRTALWSVLAERLNLDDLRREVRLALKKRQGWRAAR